MSGFWARIADAGRLAAAALRGDQARLEAFLAARAAPVLGDFPTTSLSGNRVAESAKALRGRVRHLRRNNPIVQRYELLVRDNLIGEDGGPTLQAEPLSARGTNMTLAKRLERGFYDVWAPNANSIGGTLGDAMTQVAVAWKAEGEALVEVLEGVRGAPFGVALRVWDVDQIDWDYQRAPGAGGAGAIVRGVEVDEFARPVAVHVKTVHDDDIGRLGPGRRVRLPLDKLRLLAARKSPNQIRGVTPFAPCMEILQMLGALQVALVTQHRAAAAQGGFFETDASGGNLVPGGAAPGAAAAKVPRRLEWEAIPGLYRQLPPGVKYKEANPAMPGNNYLDLYRTLIQDVAAAVNVSPISLTGDLSQVNLSSLRGGLLTERAGWRLDAQTLIAVMQWLYPYVVRGMVIDGYVQLPAGQTIQSIATASWHGRSWAFVDPLKDAQALGEELENGATSLQRSLAARGIDWRKVIDERAEELEYARTKKVPILGTGLEAGRPRAPLEGDDSTQAPAPARAVPLRSIA